MNSIWSKFTLSFLLPFLFLAVATAQRGNSESNITPDNALESYLQNGDKSFHWEIKDTLQEENVTTYNILLTSQVWQNITWKHQLSIFVPTDNKYDGALLFITGGSVKEGMPKWKKADDKLNFFFSNMAVKNKAAVAVINQVPNQPLYNGLTEDALISKTLHDFKNDKDYSKPLLFPMVKSAVRGMDAIQQFMKEKKNHAVSRFVVSGASKRGWTTWLTSAMDDRVKALGPMVIDILNMPKNLTYQVEAYGKYSEQIEDYVKLGILDDIRSESGNAIVKMIDPYSYRKYLDKPKLLFMGTNDEYWVVDNVKNYLNEIPGKNLIHYVPNAGHNLGGGVSAFAALSAFFGITLKNEAYPEDSWKTKIKKKNIRVSMRATKDELLGAKVWYANSTDHDFRNEKWESRDLNISHTGKFKVVENLPKTGYHAFYVDLKYKDANGGDYTVSSRVFLTNTKTIL
ncbi:MAG TPA: PhoPQ-activated protein PqaA family protein [Niabella sp.]|nr:PhoPQ-activated protein PqaA family protein [Niabella sp.]HOZ95743.1 PhoPQ-activated protein PqaA family protein [Niabella sp.]HQW15986.1 PhoPQ-activated protein PqaA family protein [Niabella sp.]HQX21161.1 PhoPQ-activated protein PqaA family protein [Niabella sp.]HRB36546.1 PhoPQ-activated protein PqaA family protein [Niabella sp.]